MSTTDPGATTHLLRSARVFVVLAVLAALAAVAGAPGPRPLDAALAAVAGVLAVYGYGTARRAAGGR